MNKKPNVIPAIIFFGLFCPFWLSACLVLAVQEGRAITPMILLIGAGGPVFCWCYLVWLIVQSRKPIKILTEEEKKLKNDKEGRIALIIAPFVIIALMVFGKNYSNWVLWALLSLFLFGWIQFLPKVIREPIGQFIRAIFGFVGWLLMAILIIGGVIALFHGLATISATNAILLLILWAVLSQGEKNN